MSEQWTKERIEEVSEYSNTHDLTPSRIVRDALPEIERLQSEVANLKELIGELVKSDDWLTANEHAKHTELIEKAKEMIAASVKQPLPEPPESEEK